MSSEVKVPHETVGGQGRGLRSNEESSDSILFRRCPATGLPVFEREDWSDIQLNESCRVTFKIIGQCILLVGFTGSPDGEALGRFFAERRRILDGALEPSETFYELHDYRGAPDRPNRVQREMLVHHLARDRGRLLGLWGFNASLAVKLSLTLARSLSWSDLPVYLAPDYATAVNRAVDAMQREGRLQGPPRFHRYRRDTWTIDAEDLRVDFEIINGDILHSVSRGTMRREHIELIEAVREKLGRKMALGDTTPHYFVASVSDLRIAGHDVRRRYVQSIRRWHQRRRFELFVVYGPSASLRALVALSRPLLPFKVAIAATLEEALEVVQSHKTSRMRRRSQSAGRHRKAIADGGSNDGSQVTDELLQFIGGINWEEPGAPLPERVTADHPFHAVFDAIGLIKEELDAANEEQRAAAEEREELQDLLLRSQKLEAIGTLAGGIAHDFNNILSAIVGYVELAQMESAEGSRVRSHLDHVARAADRAKDLIAQILSFSRQDTGMRKPMDPRPVVKEAVRLIRASLPSNVAIDLRITSDPLTVSSDPTQLHRMLINLCTNAGHAMEPDGGTLTVVVRRAELTSEDNRILAGRPAEPGWVELLVGDTGCGMDAETRSKVFDPYFTTKASGKGTGMGLSVVHGIVENHQGLISVDSEPGRGATFRILLPALAESADIEDSGDHVLPRGTEHILVVDDEWPLVQAAQEMLTGLGYRVTARTSSVEALEAFRATPDRFDLVITDLTMPNLSGDRLAETIAAIRPETPIVLCSGYAAMLSTERARALGIRSFLPKPIGLRDLATAVRNALDGRST
jgi:signal transduction histidine kinase/ActR/RegA family two-component response regulator